MFGPDYASTVIGCRPTDPVEIDAYECMLESQKHGSIGACPVGTGHR